MESKSIFTRILISLTVKTYPRELSQDLLQRLAHSPAVALLGPRQVGKTSLALEISQTMPSVYLDLEAEDDLSKLSQPTLYLRDHADKLVILDEVHRVPNLFPILRGLIDEARRQGRQHAMYLLLGSASIDLLEQSGETLAGRISFLELTGLNPLETGEAQADALWVRGGFPQSLRAATEAQSMQWRQDFIRTYLERDVAQFAPRISPQVLRKLWGMLAHQQGTLVNVAQLARNLELDGKTVASYIDLLTDLFLIRKLPPWSSNAGKRLVKSPKLYLRDSGLLHTLLGIANKEQLVGHPVVGMSWEGFCIENLMSVAPGDTQLHFYRDSYGFELDLLLSWPNGESWAIEIKRSLAPKLEKSFHKAYEHIKPTQKWVVYAGQDSYRLQEDVQAVPLHALMGKLKERKQLASTPYLLGPPAHD
jgi:hypothetical protein